VYIHINRPLLSEFFFFFCIPGSLRIQDVGTASPGWPM
jgi:hypothetical protein